MSRRTSSRFAALSIQAIAAGVIGIAVGISTAHADARIVPVADQPVAGTDPASLPNLVARLLPAVVSITTTQATGPVTNHSAPKGSPFEEYFREYFNKRRNSERGSALGSGFIITPDGYVVTNNHVIARATSVRVILNNEKQLSARIVGRDPRADLAVLKVEPEAPLPFVEWGDSDVVRIGHDVIAIGNPFGLSQTVTTGIISARGRHLRNFGDFPGSSFVDFLQTDAAINKGNSGGPLFSRDGKVIGINTAIYSQAGTNAGIAFAVPSNLAVPIVRQLKRYGRTRRGWLGVQIQWVDDELAKSLGMDSPTGALVASVVSGGPAAKGGVVSGDVIVTFDGKKVPSATRLPQIVAATPVGKSVKVEVIRKKKIVTFTIVLGELEKAVETGSTQNLPKDLVKPDLFPELGLRLGKITPELAKRHKTIVEQGVIVLGVDPQSYSAEKDIKPGDVILEMDQTPVKEPKELRSLLEQSKESRKTSALFLIQRDETRRFIVIRFKLQ